LCIIKKLDSNILFFLFNNNIKYASNCLKINHLFRNFIFIIIAVIVFQQDKKRTYINIIIKLFLMKYLIKILINLILLFIINQKVYHK